MITGTGLLLALTAVGVLALGTILRRAAGAVTAGIVVFVLPSPARPRRARPRRLRGSGWLYRVSPAAAFSVFGALPRSSLVDYPYTLGQRLLPAAWAGLAVLAATPLPLAWPPTCYVAETLNTLPAQPARHRRSRGAWSAAVQAEWTKLRTLPSTAWLLAGDRRHHRRRQRAVAAATHINPTGIPPQRAGPHQARPGRNRPQSSRHCRARRTDRLRGVRHRHDPRHPHRHAPPPRPPRRQRQATSPASPSPPVFSRSLDACSPGGSCSPPPGSTPPTGTHSYPSPTARRCAPPPAASSTSSLIALLALGVATAIRDTAVSIGAVLALLYLPPLLAQVVADPLRRHIAADRPHDRRPRHPSHHQPAQPARSPPGPDSACSPHGPPRLS